MRPRLYYILITIFVSMSSAKADWITEGIYSERSHIDSLERILVITDVEPEHVFGDRIVSLGDITGDGATDILVIRRETSMYDENRCFLFHGGSPPDGQYDQYFSNLKPFIEPIGDINADGYVDIGMLATPTTTYSFFFGGPDFDDIADFNISNRISWTAKAGDLDGDGQLDFVLTENFNGSYAYIYSIESDRDTIPEYIIPDTSESFGNAIATGDFNGDGWTDLAIGAALNLDTPSVKFYWGGPQFDTIPDFIIKSTNSRFGEWIVPLGDFNGDGYGDIFISGTSNDPNGIYFGGPDIDDQLDVILNAPRIGGLYWPPWSADAGGDFNNDGYPDLILGDLVPPAHYFAIHVYLGGPISDTMLLADLYIEDDMVPGPTANFGAEVANIGDFNNDGIDDFAARSTTATFGTGWYGEVNIFAGWQDQATDVEFDYEPTLPSDFELYPPYPNPFNPATTISFDIPRLTPVRVTIYDLLGRAVITLLDRPLSAGHYRLAWDGRGRQGRLASSGVYFVRVEAMNHSISRKLVLLK